MSIFVYICIFKRVSYILNNIYRPAYAKINRIYRYIYIQLYISRQILSYLYLRYRIYKHNRTFICLYMYVQARLTHTRQRLSSRTRQDKSHISTHIYTTIRIAPDSKLFLSRILYLQTYLHFHLSLYVHSSASHTYSTTFIIPYTPR